MYVVWAGESGNVIQWSLGTEQSHLSYLVEDISKYTSIT